MDESADALCLLEAYEKLFLVVSWSQLVSQVLILNT